MAAVAGADRAALARAPAGGGGERRQASRCIWRSASAALAWEGFSQGVGAPLDLRLARVTATDAAGAPLARVPSAELAVAVAPLLLGQIAPTGLAVDGARLKLTRGADGAIGFGGGTGRAPPRPGAGRRAARTGRPRKVPAGCISMRGGAS